MSDRILVTGASGFIGAAVCEDLLARGFEVRGSYRSLPSQKKIPAGVERVHVPVIGAETDWSQLLAGVDVVVHLAARVHVMNEFAADPLAAFRAVNTAGTRRLAEMAARRGVRRLVYVSTIKVNGEQTTEAAFTENDAVRPADAYARSKWEAEEALRSVAEKTGLETVVLRPPLVYGKEVRANFLQLLDLVSRGVPLPFAGVRNRRSLLYLDNLANAISLCITHPTAVGRTYLLCDGEDVSTAELIRQLGKALGRRTRMISVPSAWLRFVGILSGKSAQIGRLIESLAIDSSEIRRELAWKPPCPMSKALHETASWYLAKKAANRLPQLDRYQANS